MNKIVDVKGYDTDRYNRILEIVYIGDINVSLEMVKAGLVEVYQGKPPRGIDLTPFRLAEKEAKDASRGMWSIGDKYISPRDWRKTRG